MIPIYKKEVELGLAELIQSSGRIIYSSAIDIGELPKNLKNIPQYSSNGSQITIEDLYPIKDILVSTGMNLNDDVFDPEEVWKAKSTPENKPLNEEHDSTKVRGHIIKSIAISADSMDMIAENTSIDELPLNFHLLNHSVLYKFLKTDLEEHMAQIISEIKDGLWYMSQECLFKDFDYAIANKEGVQKIISRNKDTAFLTKYLRAFGGCGEYEGQKIGRLARNMVFCGKGLVKKPANPNSVIFSKMEPIKNNLVYSSITMTQNKEEKRVMTDQVDINKLINELAASKEAQNKLVAELAEVKGEKQQLADQIKSADIKAIQEKVSNLEKTLAEKEKALDEATKQLTKSAEVQVELNKKADGYKAELDTAKAELDKKAIAQKNVDRANKLVSQKKVKEVKAAEAIVANLTSLNDEAFDKFVANLPDVAVVAEETDPIADAQPQGNVALNVANAGENSVAKIETEALGLLLANINKEKK